MSSRILNLSHISAMMKLGAVIPYLKKIQKIYKPREYMNILCVLLTSTFFLHKPERDRVKEREQILSAYTRLKYLF